MSKPSPTPAAISPASTSPTPLKNQARVLVLSLVSLMLAMTVALTGAEIWSKKQEMLRAYELQTDNIALSLQEQIHRLVAWVDQATMRLRDEALEGQVTPSQYVLVANETGLTPTILTQLSHVGGDGLFLGSNLDPKREISGAVDLSKRDHVRVHLDADFRQQKDQKTGGVSPDTQIAKYGLYVSVPVLGKVSGKWTIQLSRPIIKNDRIIGVVVASLNPEYFESIFSKVKLGSSGGVTLVGTDQIVRAQVLGGIATGLGETLSPIFISEILAQAQSKSASNSLPDLEADAFDFHAVINRIWDRSFGWLVRLQSTEGRISSSMPIGDYPLSVYVHASTREMLADWRNHAALALTLCGLFCITLVVGAITIFRSLTKLESSQLKLLEAQREALEHQEAQVSLLQQNLEAENKIAFEEAERRRAESAQLAAEASNHTKSEFLTLMSHELRTPMAGVVGMLSLALKSELTGAQRQQISLARHNAESLLIIVNDLLDLSKIEAGKMVVEHIDFDLRSLLCESTQLLRERADARSLGFDLVLHEGLPEFVVGDPTRLRQVLINLIGNALKFTEKGEVRVEAKLLANPPFRLRDHAQEGEVWVRFSVTDTGIGMSQEAKGRMFQKFEQADTSTTRKFGGTGLGLSICKLLVELMDGQIGVDSELGRGSTFWFDVPLPYGKAPVLEEVYEVKPHGVRLKVLVAEDVLTNQIIIESLLGQLGHDCKLVENGDDALLALSQEDYDVVLMDGRMPVMDGLEASRRIRGTVACNYPVRNPKIPILALTANAGEHDRSKFLEAGMDAFLTKPIDEVALHKALAEVIARLPADKPTDTPNDAAQDSARLESLAQLDDLLGFSAEGLSTLDQGTFTQTETLAGLQPDPQPRAEVLAKPADHSQADAAPANSKAALLKERMLASFKEQVPLKLSQIDVAVAAGDWNMAAITVHGLKGSLAYLWPDSDLFRLASQMETWADASDSEAFNEGLVKLKLGLVDVEC